MINLVKGPLKFKIEIEKDRGGEFSLWLYESHSVYLDGQIFWSMFYYESVKKDHGFFYRRAIKKLMNKAREIYEVRSYNRKPIEFSFEDKK